MVQPPPEIIQNINALLHREPFSSIAYAAFWSLILILGTPIAVTILGIQLVFCLGRWIFFSHTTVHDDENKERAILITGCDTGFGKEIAIVASNAGFTVFAGILRKESNQQFQGLDRIHPIEMDVTSDKQVELGVQLFQKWQKESSGKTRVLHAICNNAGIGVGGDIDWLDLDTYRSVMEVNFFGILRVTKAFLPILKKQSLDGVHKDARILNLVSMAGMLPPAVGTSAYSASKSAAYSLSTAMRVELSVFDIKVVTVNPTFHGTPLVQSMNRNIEDAFDALPREKQEEYGRDYLTKYKKLGVDIPHSMTWKMEVVVDQIMRLLSDNYLPVESIIGSDGRFGLMPIRTIPIWYYDLFFKIFGRPVPDIVKRKRASVRPS